MHARAGRVDGHGVLLQGGQGQVAQEEAAVGEGGGAEAAVPLGNGGEDGGPRGPGVVEQFLGAVGAQPLLQLRQVLRIGAYGGQGHLVGAPGVLHGQSVDLGGAGPALGGAQDDHGPAGAAGGALLAGGPLDRGDAVEGGVHGAGRRAVDGGGFVAGDVDRIVSTAAQQFVELGLGEAGEDRRVGDLVAVEVQDRQDGAVVHRVEELVGVPGRRQRAGLRLSVADHAGDRQVRVVEGRAVGVRERVAQFAALVDGARRLGCDVARYAAGERELLEEQGHAGRVPGDVRIGLGVRALQPRVGQDGGTAVAGAPDTQGVEVTRLDHPVEVGVDQVEAG